MDKLKMQSENIVNENIDKIASLFPNCITEGKNENGETIKLVDFDLLKQELSNVVVDGDKERYVMNWPDKKQAILTANAPIAKTFRPCKKESVGKDGAKGGFDSENLYIEGDNLDVLKLLRETYLNKIKMIYIDPPYNTGNDFVYNDDFATDTEDYLQRSNQVDDQGNRMITNADSNGRFHTDWLNMIYPRIKLAKDLLSTDGVIFISIDDNELDNLNKICNEIFGECNFIANVIWEKNYAPKNNAKQFSANHDYILCYAKSINDAVRNLLPATDEQRARYKNPDNDPRGDWKASDFSTMGNSIANKYEITLPSGRVVKSPSGRSWGCSKEKFEKMVQDNRIWFGSDGNSVPAVKKFLSEVQDGMVPLTIWNYNEVGHTQESRQELIKLMGCDTFDTPKPVKLIKKMLQIYTNNESVVLDFFSGSATTAHAVMQLNAEDGGNRKFIMVQLPEVCDEKSEAYKAGYKNICEIGKERIRRAGEKIRESLIKCADSIKKVKECGKPFVLDDGTTGLSTGLYDTVDAKERIKNNLEVANMLDIGFRDLKIDSSCMKDVYYTPSAINQDLLAGLEDNIKEDRTPEDLLFQVMLDMGVLLSSEIKTIDIKGKKVFNVNDGNLVCCFDKNLTDEVVTEIAKLHPLYAVFRDGSMSSDSVAINFDQIFETYSPTTTKKVL